MGAAVVPLYAELNAVAHLDWMFCTVVAVGKYMSCKSGAGKSGAGDECSGGSSKGGVERRGPSSLKVHSMQV